MNLYILSTRQFVKTPSNGIVVELEDILVETCDAQLITLEKHQRSPILQHLMGSKFSTDIILDRNPADRVLLMITLSTHLLEVLNAIENWRNQFAIVAAYILDPWRSWNCWPKNAPRELDCVFVPDIRVAEQFQKFHRVKTEPLPMAADVLRFGSGKIDRPLDLVGYGRQDPEYIHVFEKAFNNPYSSRFLYHDTLLGLQAKSFRENRRLIWKLLHKSKCTLAFDPLAVPGQRGHDRSVIPIRYYEGIAAGSAIVGKRPQVPEMDIEFDWPDATIELPDSPDEALPFLETLLDDNTRLEMIHKRNYSQAWQRHDWRYRLRDMFVFLQIPLPSQLTQELSILSGPPKN